MAIDKILLKERIEKKIKRLHSDIASMEDMTQPVSPDDAIGRVSRMDAINNKSVMEASLRNARQKLNGLEFALKNLNSETFGICHKCHKPIQEARVMLMPESLYCVACG